MPAGDRAPRRLPAAVQLPATLLARYLFFLGRRPISRSNQHYFASRLAGLQSLGPLLTEAGDPALEAAASELALLTPATFAHRAARLQALLAPLLAREPAPGVVVAASPPGDEFFAPVERATLIFGPAIGVGDEILCCGAARRLRARLPSARLTVLTAYDGLWQRMAAVDRADRYRHHAELVAAIRGDGPAGRADLVALFDFEKPDLLAAVGGEPAVQRYVELSVGGASAAAYDAGGGWLHRFTPPEGGERNHYARLEELLDWLCGAPPAPGAEGATGSCTASRLAADATASGIATGATNSSLAPGTTDSSIAVGPRGSGLAAGAMISSLTAGFTDSSVVAWPALRSGRGERREILVSPFTSKQEPSLVYWSRLLVGLAAPPAAADGGRGAEGLAAPWPRLLLRLDPGPNLATAAFAAALAQAVRTGSGTLADVEVLCAGGRRTSTLADVLAAIDSAEVVLTSDSFAAHAAPLAGCLTLVVAQPGLQEWRVPSPCSFYFEDALPLPAVAGAMRLLLAAGAPQAAGNGGRGHRPAPWRPPAAGRLLAATRRLAAELAPPAPPAAPGAPALAIRATEASEATAATEAIKATETTEATKATAAADAAVAVVTAGAKGGGAAPRQDQDWRRTYEEAAGALRAVTAAFDQWPRAAAALLADRPYEGLLPVLPSLGPASPGAPLSAVRAQELRRHARARLSEWQNSNLHKYLALAAEPATADEGSW